MATTDTEVLANLATDEGVWDSLGALIAIVPEFPEDLILDFGEFEAIGLKAKADYLYEVLDFVLTDEFYDKHGEIAGTLGAIIALAVGIPLPPQFISLISEAQFRAISSPVKLGLKTLAGRADWQEALEEAYDEDRVTLRGWDIEPPQALYDLAENPEALEGARQVTKAGITGDTGELEQKYLPESVPVRAPRHDDTQVVIAVDLCGGHGWPETQEVSRAYVFEVPTDNLMSSDLYDYANYLMRHRPERLVTTIDLTEEQVIKAHDSYLTASDLGYDFQDLLVFV